MCAVYRNIFVALIFVCNSALAQSLTTLVHFGGSSTAPSGPAGTLIRATDGNYYGTTFGGGTTQSAGANPAYGTIFKMTPNGTLSILYSFCADINANTCVVGLTPSGLIQASDGNLYGTTAYGGANGIGTVFKVTLGGSFTVLHSFCASCNEGSYPAASLVQGSDGNLYGTTRDGSDGAGGTNAYGSIFKISLSGVVTTLHTFCSSGTCTDGQTPLAALIQSSDGNFYGTTYYGGRLGSGTNGLGGGTIFKITASGAFIQLYRFCSLANCADGTGPNSLVAGSDGAFYGTTRDSVYDSSLNLIAGGTAFRLTTSGVLTSLHNFCVQANCVDGESPRAGLLRGNDGNFYGTTSTGGADDTRGAGGTVFRMTPSGALSTLYAFCAKPDSKGYCLDGEQPLAALVQGVDGVLYGTTAAGGNDDGDFGAGTAFALNLPAEPKAGEAARGAQADYLGEDKAGFTVWRPSTGYWYSIDGAGASAVGQWGEPTDLPVTGDFDGDGQSDFAVFRPATGFWYIKRSSDQQVEAQQWGTATDLPIAGDFDGDGKTDLAVYRPTTGFWYIIRSSDKAVVAKQFGVATDLPVVGDFDGDGKSDIAVYRPSTGYWYVTESGSGSVVATRWGAATDIPVSADFDGDGKTDIAVYRPSTGYWYIIQSSNGQVVAKQWGQAGDVPVARDYDGDGKADLAVWRPSTGYWYVIKSSSGQTVAQQWGAATDISVNSVTR